jgi:hypothetical protein
LRIEGISPGGVRAYSISLNRYGTSVEPHQSANPTGIKDTPGVMPTAASAKQIVAMIRKTLLAPMSSSFDVGWFHSSIAAGLTFNAFASALIVLSGASYRPAGLRGRC